MIPKGNINDELIESIANEILSYLESHPNSVDNLDGIAKWWLKKQRYHEARSNVKLAVGRLLSAGKIQKTVISQGSVVYSVSSGSRAGSDNESFEN